MPNHDVLLRHFRKLLLYCGNMQLHTLLYSSNQRTSVSVHTLQLSWWFLLSWFIQEELNHLKQIFYNVQEPHTFILPHYTSILFIYATHTSPAVTHTHLSSTSSVHCNITVAGYWNDLMLCYWILISELQNLLGNSLYSWNSQFISCVTGKWKLKVTRSELTVVIWLHTCTRLCCVLLGVFCTVCACVCMCALLTHCIFL